MAHAPPNKIFGGRALDVKKLSELRQELDYAHPGQDRDIGFYKAMRNYSLEFVTSRGIEGQDLHRWKDRDHQDGLYEMATAFLERDGNGIKYWPDDKSHPFYGKLQYSRDFSKIKSTLVQLFYRSNQQRKRVTKQGGGVDGDFGEDGDGADPPSSSVSEATQPSKDISSSSAQTEPYSTSSFQPAQGNTISRAADAVLPPDHTNIPHDARNGIPPDQHTIPRDQYEPPSSPDQRNNLPDANPNSNKRSAPTDRADRSPKKRRPKPLGMPTAASHKPRRTIPQPLDYSTTWFENEGILYEEVHRTSRGRPIRPTRRASWVDLEKYHLSTSESAVSEEVSRSDSLEPGSDEDVTDAQETPKPSEKVHQGLTDEDVDTRNPDTSGQNGPKRKIIFKNRAMQPPSSGSSPPPPIPTLPQTFDSSGSLGPDRTYAQTSSQQTWQNDSLPSGSRPLSSRASPTAEEALPARSDSIHETVRQSAEPGDPRGPVQHDIATHHDASTFQDNPAPQSDSTHHSNSRIESVCAPDSAHPTHLSDQVPSRQGLGIDPPEWFKHLQRSDTVGTEDQGEADRRARAASVPPNLAKKIRRSVPTAPAKPTAPSTSMPPPPRSIPAQGRAKSGVDVVIQYWVYTSPGSCTKWDLKNTFAKKALAELVGELPFEGKFSRLSLTLKADSLYCKSAMDVGDEEEFSGTKSQFQDQMRKHVNAQKEKTGKIVFGMHIEPEWEEVASPGEGEAEPESFW